MKKIKILTIVLFAALAISLDASGKALPLPAPFPACNSYLFFTCVNSPGSVFNFSIYAGSPINSFYIEVQHLSINGVLPLIPGWTLTSTPGTAIDRYTWTLGSGTFVGQQYIGILYTNSSVLNYQQVSYGFSDNLGVSWTCTTSDILPSCNSCNNTATFTAASNPNPNCCYTVEINVGSPINSFYIDVPHLSTTNTPANISGWTLTFTSGSIVDRFLWSINAGNISGYINLGQLCFTGSQTINYGFPTTAIGGWMCGGHFTLPACVSTPPPCSNYAIFTPSYFPNIDCCFKISIDGTSPINAFYVDIPHVTSAVYQITPNSPLGWTKTFSSITATTDRYLWTLNSGSITGPVQIGGRCFLQPGTYGFSNTGGAPWSCVTSYILPECGPPPCNDIATFTAANVINIDCCFKVEINAVTPINAFYVDVPISSTYGTYGTTLNSPIGWTKIFSSSTATTDRYLWTFNGVNFTGTVLLGSICFRNSQSQQVSYGFSNTGGIPWFCTGVFTLPMCVRIAPCNITIQAQPPIICNNQGSTITSTGYTGTGSIVWYQATSDPGTTNASLPPWVLTGSTGMSINTGNLTCNPPNEVTKYWYMAILTDPLCTVSPVYSNIVTVTVNPVFNSTVTGDMVLCTGGGFWNWNGILDEWSWYSNFFGGRTTLTLNGLGTNTSCSVIWMDLQNNTQIVPITNSNNQQISLGPLTASFTDCPFKMYYYNVTVCNGVCNATIPIAIKVFSRSKATDIAADKSQLCWNQDTKVHLINHNYCGDIQWQIKGLLGTGGLWVDIPGAYNTLAWNTDHLIENTYYRVRFTNGVCPPAYSNELLVSVEPQVSAVISYISVPTWSCEGLLCSTVSFSVVVNPSTATWQWYKNGVPIPQGNNQIPTYATNDPGDYSVVVFDPLCGNVTSNVLTAFSVSAILIGPTCVCFNPSSVFDLTVVPNCAASGPFILDLYGNSTSNIIISGTFTPDADGNIILHNIHLNPGDKFWVKIKGICGTTVTNFYEPDGCNCPH